MRSDETRPPERTSERRSERPVERRVDQPSERPVTDPHGPGTTFFTNHPDDVVAREKDVYGGVRVSAAFFGWLSATGLLTILLGLLGGAGAAFMLSRGAEAGDALRGGTTTTGLAVGAALLLAAVFLAYVGGGYVAGRMARFDGLRQGLAVWIVALVLGVLVAVLGLVAGDRSVALPRAEGVLGTSLDGGDLMTGGGLAALAVALVALGGALLGGAAGTRYHRKVDRVGLLTEPEGEGAAEGPVR